MSIIHTLGIFFVIHTITMNCNSIIVRRQLAAGNNSSCSLHQLAGLSCVYLFVVLRRLQHCTGHITTGSWKGRGNQYIEFARVVYCKLPTNGKQLPAFPLEPVRGSNPGLRGGRQECYHSATVAPGLSCGKHLKMYCHISSWCCTNFIL